MRLCLFLFIISIQIISAQQPGSGSYTAPITSLYTDTTPNLDFIPKKKRDFKIKEKKVPKNLFYGVRTKKGFAFTGKGKTKITELFYFIPVYKEPDIYVPTVYWYHIKKRKVFSSPILEKDQKFARLLHGPYVKKTAYEILEEGIFYVGSKHGRWEKYDKNYILIEKIKYFRGWTRESMISYYDQDRKKIQEIVPIQYGVKTGKYYKFYESGLLAEEGSYAEGQKIGSWVEFYDDRKKRKKVTQYPKDPYDKETQPIVLKEWDATGRLLFDKASQDQFDKKKTKSKK
ncbi:MAG: hypothetical protein H7329_01135 [Opitutaceae bacterium]|nr:hypothetical protein [Cytophagales bacterium]